MTVRLLSAGDMTDLRACLVELGYSVPGLTAAVGLAVPPKRADLPRFLHATREAAALPLLVRVFLAGMAAPKEIVERVWPERFVTLCREAGLLDLEQGMLTPRVTLVPRGDLLFASDALAVLGSDDAHEFVLPASVHAAGYLLDLTFRREVADTLDLGTGCGVQALFAAGHSGHVVASDVSPRAMRYTQFNARLNGLENIECVTGDLFGPVAGRRFDLIVANPPFVPGPGGKFVYRDTGLALDGLCRTLVREVPAFLNEGGCLQMLCEWVEIENERWQERLNDWLEGLGCDCWVLRSPPQAPASYAALRVAEVSGPAQVGSSEEYGDWIEHFKAHRVRAIHPGVIIMRRRQGRNWLHVQPLAREIRGPAAEAILENIRACDFLAARTQEDELLDVILRPAPELRLEQQLRPTGEGWRAQAIRLWLDGSLPMDAEIDPATAALLREFDGSATVRECVSRFAQRANDQPDSAERRCLPAVRFLVERGFLLPPER